MPEKMEIKKFDPVAGQAKKKSTKTRDRSQVSRRSENEARLPAGFCIVRRGAYA
jgi:hypothetical protein